MTDIAEHKAQLRAYFDGIGFERWSAIYGAGELSRVRRAIRAGHTSMLALAERWLDEYVPLLPAGANVLDAGCGTGLWSVALAQRGLAVAAVDIAPQMARATAERAQAAGVGEQVHCQAADLETVGGSYDLVSCFDVLIHYPNQSFGSLLRHLAERTTGRLLFTYAPRRPLLVALHWLGGRFPRGQRRTEIVMQSDDFVQQTLEQAGLRVLRTAGISSGFYYVTLVEAEKR